MINRNGTMSGFMLVSNILGSMLYRTHQKLLKCFIGNATVLIIVLNKEFHQLYVMGTLAKANDIIGTTVDSFRAGMVKTGVNAWLRIVGPLNRMDKDSQGKVHSSPNNTAAMMNTVTNMTLTTLTNTYFQRVESLKEPLDPIADIIRDYYVENFGEILPVVDKKIIDVTNATIKRIDDMMGTEAINSQVINPTIESLSHHITQRSTHAAMMKDMDLRVKERYSNFAGPRAEDILQQFARDINDLMRINFRFVWVKYVGGLIETSRDWCEDHNDKYFHIEEVKRWPNEEWDGKIEGTNKYTIFTVAGGYNCRHNFEYVPADKVPQSVKNRVKASGLG